MQSHFQFIILMFAGNDFTRHLQGSSEFCLNGESSREMPLDRHCRGPANLKLKEYSLRSNLYRQTILDGELVPIIRKGSSPNSKNG